MYLRNNFCSFPNSSWSQLTKFGKLIFNRFWGVLCQPVHPQSNLKHFYIFSCLIVLFGFCLELALELDSLEINFCSFPTGTWNQPTKFGKLMSSGFWGVLCQPVHLKSIVRLFCTFFLLYCSLVFSWKMSLS